MKLIPLATLAIIFLTYSPLSHAQRTSCNRRNRPPIEQCYSVAYQPVCAYYTQNCPFSVCAIQKSNACEACSDSTVNYHEPGTCPTNLQVLGCSSTVCNPANDYYTFSNRDFYEPVCAVQRRCNSRTGACQATVNNVCRACSTPNTFPFYYQGPCETDKRYCGNTRPTNCPATGSTVCANFNGSDTIEHFVTVSTGCNACKDPSVNYYVQGACGKPSRNETYCLPNSRPQFCTMEYNPVCAFYTAPGGGGHQVMSSACVACSNSSVIYHTPGPCIFWCERNPMLAIDCGGILEPVCGSYRENGVVKQISFRNGCLGCYYNRYNIDSYTEGLCPGDDGILCVNNGGAFAEGQLQPVCALRTLNCNSASCRKTIADPLTACQGSTYVKYIPGYCPGDKGVSCNDYRTRPQDGQYQFTYGEVCGYRSRNCNSNSCRSNFTDHWAACASSRVLFFTAGPC